MVHFGTRRAPTCPSGGGDSHFNHGEIISLSVTYLLQQFLAGVAVTPRMVMEAVPEFAVYRAANSIGDAFGPNHETAAGLYHRKGKKSREYPAVFENASRVFDLMAEAQRESFAAEQSMTVEDVVAAIEKLPRTT